MNQCFNPNCLQQNQLGSRWCNHCGSSLLLKQQYRGLKLIGQGGFGQTFLVIDEQNTGSNVCVVKQFFPRIGNYRSIQKAAELFAREAVALQHLGKHPHIPQLLDYFTQEQHQYLVQEYIPGDNLAQELLEKGACTEAEIRSLLVDILAVLDFLHAHQVIHRDIKPENIIRRYHDGKLYLVDLGAAKYVSTTPVNITGTIIGSAEYAAPEQVRGRAMFASDLYSLGVTCIHLLTNVRPFDLFDLTESEWVWRDYLVNNPVSEDLVKILDRMIINATKKRFQSAREVLQALNISPSQNNWLNPVKPRSPRIVLKNGTKINCDRLEKYLKAGKWKEADLETANLMLKVAQTQQNFLSRQDIAQFPCIALQTLDQLWLKYSDRRFGFSIQKDIYQHFGGSRVYSMETWQVFGELVGWRSNSFWLAHDELTFTLTAPRGHLPFRWAFGLWQGWCGELIFSWFFERMQVCGF